ncbi:hypothetical protein BXZ70DRAFT_334374 [Cristinia sonorae]|uniref:NADH dehydrogenase [ubiquinone] 1 beta subcomplex subunit 9 n=1 Tax=Cristinia sonorae TaxID=1940300 RepID=A0A8K0ULG1_9AGAR|nr:hypothetical protein BXZ70DRAFT_334374 [Cristinia sonorae]
MSGIAPFTVAHRSYVKSLYRRILKNELDWIVRRDIWRGKAVAIRAEFDRNRDVSDPRALAAIFAKTEAELAARRHPDPYRREFIPCGFELTTVDTAQWIAPSAPDGTKWERNAPPPLGPIFDHETYNRAHGH